MTDGLAGSMRRHVGSFVSGAFAVALALLLVLVLRSVAVQVTPPPEVFTEPYPDVSTEETCAAEGGRWIDQPQEIGARGAAVPVAEKIQPYCQGPLAFEREREAQAEASRQTSLFVFAIGGGAAVAAGVLLRAARGVAPGLLLGGIAAFFFAGIEVWRLSPGLGRLVTIVLVFIVLVGLGLWIFREQRAEGAPSSPAS